MHYKNFKKCCDYKNENVYFPVMELKFKQRGCSNDIILKRGIIND